MTTIVSVVILVYIALLGLFAALPARKYHWSMALVRTGIIIVSAVIAVPVAQAIAGSLAGMISPMVEDMLGGGDMADLSELMTHAPILEESVVLMAGLLITPILFLLLFIVIRGILGIAGIIVSKTVPFFKTKAPKNTAIAVPVGAFNGVLIALITLIPIFGYIMMANSIMDVLDMGGDENNNGEQQEVMAVAPSYDYLSDMMDKQPSMDEGMKDENHYENKDQYNGNDHDGSNQDEGDDLLSELLEVLDNPVIGAVNTVGSPLFDWMTTGRVKGGEGDKAYSVNFTLSKDLPHLTESVMDLADSFAGMDDGQFTNDEKEAMVAAVDNLLASDWVAEVMAQSISYIAGQWKEGKEFMGMPPLEIGDMLQPILDTTWDVLATENGDTLRKDMKTITEILADLMTLGFLEENGDNQDLMTQLAGGENSTLSHIMQVLGENEHMAILADEIRGLGLRLVSDVMGDTLKNTTEYDGMMDTVAEHLNAVKDLPKEERKEFLQENIKTAFADQEIDVPEDLAVEMAEKAITDLEAQGDEITGENLKQYFIDHMDENVEDLGGAVDEETFEGIEIPDMN